MIAPATKPIEPAEVSQKTDLRLPNFVIIGAAKSGTTTLYEYLLRHPDVMMPELKEPEFFSRNEVYSRGMDWYGSLFTTANPAQLCGEASTTYSRWPHTADAASRLARKLPEVKLIYLMRNPVERAYSHYAHHMRLGITCTFEEALERSNEYVDCGLYMMQISRYLRYFGQDRFLFLFTDDLKNDPAGTLQTMQSFLGLPVEQLTEPPITANKGGADHFIRKHTTRKLRQMPGVNLLADRMPSGLRQMAYDLVCASPAGKRLKSKFQLQPMLDETRQRLIDFYKEPNERLAEFLGRDLSHWNDPKVSTRQSGVTDSTNAKV